jgi:hypothetical protein
MHKTNPADVATKYITRMPDPLWRVWVKIGNIDLGQQYFSDKQCGSMALSWIAAVEYRDKIMKQHKLKLRTYSGDGFYTTTRTNAYSPVPGIGLMVDDIQKPSKINWCCRNMVGGVQTRRAFSIRKYGYQGAWELAAALRAAHTDLTIPKKAPTPPDWLAEWLRQLEAH